MRCIGRRVAAASRQRRLAERGTVGVGQPRRPAIDSPMRLPAPTTLAELYVRRRAPAPGKPTTLNSELLAARPIAQTESFTFISNDNKHEVEAFLTKPLGLTATRSIR